MMGPAIGIACAKIIKPQVSQIDWSKIIHMLLAILNSLVKVKHYG
jgi:hypothetical protein